MFRRGFVRTLGAAALATLVLGACQSMPAGAPGKSLYDRLGGQPAIVAVVDDFVGNVAADARINAQFANTNIPRLKRCSSSRSAPEPAGPASTRVAT